jgi:hypothetical protein
MQSRRNRQANKPAGKAWGGAREEPGDRSASQGAPRSQERGSHATAIIGAHASAPADCRKSKDASWQSPQQQCCEGSKVTDTV